MIVGAGMTEQDQQLEELASKVKEVNSNMKEFQVHFSKKLKDLKSCREVCKNSGDKND